MNRRSPAPYVYIIAFLVGLFAAAAQDNGEDQIGTFFGMFFTVLIAASWLFMAIGSIYSAIIDGDFAPLFFTFICIPIGIVMGWLALHDPIRKAEDSGKSP